VARGQSADHAVSSMLGLPAYEPPITSLRGIQDSGKATHHHQLRPFFKIPEAHDCNSGDLDYVWLQTFGPRTISTPFSTSATAKSFTKHI